MLPFRRVPLEEKLPEGLEALDATHLVVELGVGGDVEVVEDFPYLGQVLVLHLSPSSALLARRAWVGEQDLVDDDVADIDVLLGELD